MFSFYSARWVFVAAIDLFALFVATGCSGHGAQKPDPNNVGVVAIASPRELFPGDLKRLEPHLDLKASGCVALKIREHSWRPKLALQVWTKGKPSKPQFIGETSREVDELSISLKEVCDQPSQVKVTIAEHEPKGFSGFSVVLEKPALRDPRNRLGGFVKTLLGETPIKKDEPTTLWGYMWGEGGRIDLDETFEEMAKRQEWAILLKVTPTKKE